jgi:hypothetical protein
MADEVLTDSQLIALSQGGKAQIVQVILPKDDCTLQEQALQGAWPSSRAHRRWSAASALAPPLPGAGCPNRTTTKPTRSPLAWP